MRESVERRHRRILRVVRERESVRVGELAALLGVSVETARRDVAALAAVGRVRRLHGTVTWPTAPLNARDARLARRSAPRAAGGPVLGMVVPVSDYYFRAVVQGARQAAADAGARLLVGVTDYSADRDLQHVATLLAAGADGLLLTPSWSVDGPTREEAARFAEPPLPTVLVERRIPLGVPGAQLDRVVSDHACGAALAVRHLARLGHRRVALLARHTHTRAAVRTGYLSAVQALDLPDDDLSPPPNGPWGHPDDSARERLLALIGTGEVRAALVHTDIDALNLLQWLTAHGVRVPDDFALVCHNDETAALADVPLTSVSPATFAVGEAAVRLLLRRFEDPDAAHSAVEWLPRLVVRDSCGAGRKADGPGRKTDGSGRRTGGPGREADGSGRKTDASGRETDGPGRKTDRPARETDGPARKTDGAKSPPRPAS
ncbi:substrate-binding domain-containing protein [Streptomyces sp. NPDC035033]|uniref:substrate-binding domain-containing protein n=1 Tax=Streptomyces sp. NPDC035033 TaxID=3155368 RepID=UPI003400A154